MAFESISQDFDGIDRGAYPSGWERDGSEDQRVVGSTSYAGSHSLELRGSHGGCWQAIANAPFGGHPGSDQIRLSGAIRPAVAGSVGCHNKSAYGRVKLRTDAGSWSSGKARHLLKLGRDGLSGSGLDLGDVTPGEWFSYAIDYSYQPDAGTVAIGYTIDGTEAGRTTVEATDFETNLSYVAFQSGDFTAYWDEVAVRRTGSDSTGSPPTTEPDTSTPRRPRTATPEPTASPESAYEFQSARQEVQVQPIETNLLVLTGIPGADGKPAVTTTDYQLVDTDTARDAFVTFTHGQSGTGFDWDSQLTYARTMRDKHQMSEWLNKAVTLGWDALAAYAMAQVNPAAGLGVAIEALQDSTAWAIQEVNDPYREAMSKQTQWTYTHNEIQSDFENANSLLDMSDRMYSFLETGYALGDLVNDLSSSGILTAARSAYSSSSSFTTSLSAAGGASAGAAAGPLFYAAVGTLVSEGVDTVTMGMERNAKLSAIGHAYSTTRIPVIERIVELESRRAANTLSPCGAWELAYLTMNHHYMGAFANHGMHRQAQAIRDSLLGGAWDTLVNVGEVASVLRERSSNYQWGGAAAHHDYAERMRRAAELTENSINRAERSDPTPLGGNA